MTISSESYIKTYSGNGSTTVFAYNFKINDESHLEVIIADDEDNQTTLTLTTHYTVSGVGEDSGGNVTVGDISSITGEAGTELPSGWTISISRVVPLKQLTDLENQGGFYASTHEDAFDYLTMITHQLQEQLDRCLTVSKTSGLTGSSYLTQIQAAQTAAEAAQTAAEAAQTAAETAETNAETAEANAETAEANAETAEANAEDWATETSSIVQSTDYSSKEYAVGTQRRGAANGGSAKDWATYTGGTVDDTDYSAKYYASLAEDYANDISINTFEYTATGSETYVDVSGFTLAQSLDNIMCFIDGVFQEKSSLTRTSDTRLTLGGALTTGQVVEIRSASFNASATSEAAASASAAATSASEAAADAAALDVINAKGSMLQGDASGVPEELTAGSENQVLTMNSSGKAEWKDASSGIVNVAQSSHGFSVLTPVYYDATASEWKAAQANSGETLATHVIISVVDTDNFKLAQLGRFTVSSHGKTVDTTYFTSTTSSGSTVASEPSTGYSNPCFFVVDANTIDVYVGYRPNAIGDGIVSDSEIGLIQDFGGATLPTGFLFCNGQAVSRTTYADLFNVIGTRFGVGDGSTTFNLPIDVNLKTYSVTTSGPSGWSELYSDAIPYVDNEGNWFISGRVAGTLSANGSFNIGLTGITFKNTGYSSEQAVSLYPNATDGFAKAVNNTGNIAYSGGNVTSILITYADVALESKPTFVDDNSTSDYNITKIIRYSPKAALNGDYINGILSLSSDTTLTTSQIQSNKIINVTTGSSSNVTITLPEGTTDITGYPFKIFKADSGTKFVEIARSGSDTIRGSATSIYAIQENEYIELMWNGTEYQLLNDVNRTVSVLIANSGTPSITRTQGGGWTVSLTDNGTGDTSITILTGVFSSTPDAYAQIGGTATYMAMVNDISTTNVDVDTAQRSDGAAADADFFISLIGKK